MTGWRRHDEFETRKGRLFDDLCSLGGSMWAHCCKLDFAWLGELCWFDVGLTLEIQTAKMTLEIQTVKVTALIIIL